MGRSSSDCFRIIDGLKTSYEEDLEVFNDDRYETDKNDALNIENDTAATHNTNNENNPFYFTKELTSQV
ncbi:23184_t:CDS:2, partial [Racocetra persica]